MSREDFDIASLARYLHLSPAQVTKMAERELLPGRRIGGQWRFSRQEVHHWLEHRLGTGDEELTHVENVLNVANAQRADISIAGLLPLEAIEIPLNARTRNSVITSMVEVAARTGSLWDVQKMTDAVRAREELHSTALQSGVALLHPRRPLPQILEDTFLALGRTGSGIPFGDSRGHLTDLFFLICSTDDAMHLRVLARLSRLLMDAEFLDSLRTAQNAAEAHRVIEATEQRLFAS
jgi:PTS system nitrogen regulatory IIA component